MSIRQSQAPSLAPNQTSKLDQLLPQDGTDETMEGNAQDLQVPALPDPGILGEKTIFEGSYLRYVNVS